MTLTGVFAMVRMMLLRVARCSLLLAALTVGALVGPLISVPVRRNVRGLVVLDLAMFTAVVRWLLLLNIENTFGLLICTLPLLP